MTPNSRQAAKIINRRNLTCQRIWVYSPSSPMSESGQRCFELWLVPGVQQFLTMPPGGLFSWRAGKPDFDQPGHTTGCHS